MVPDRAFSNDSRLACQRGSSIFELTVVITLFLLLVGVVFIGFKTWKIEVDESTCLTNLSGIQKAVESYQNSNAPASAALENYFENAWKKGYNKGACVVNLSSIQKALRGYQQANGLVTGDPITVATLTSAGYWSRVPECPAGGTYSFLSTIPATGVALATCSIATHAPSQADLDNW